MSPHDSGVTELLRRASDDLAPDVDRLVRGGITRGRSRQRRARIGTTVASLAVFGVVGALAAVVPQLDGAGTRPRPAASADRRPRTATDGDADAVAAPTPPPTGVAGHRGRRDPGDRRTASSGTTLAGSPRPPDAARTSTDDRVRRTSRYDGMLTTVGIELDCR